MLLKYKKISKIISLLLAVSILPCAFGCSKISNVITPKTSAPLNEVNVSISDKIETLDPTLNTQPECRTILEGLFEGLTRLDEKDVPILAQAKSITRSEDGKTITIKLYDNLKWSDSKEVKAGDFVFAWRRAVNKNTKSKNSQLFDIILNADEIRNGAMPADSLGAAALDDKTIEVHLLNPCSYFENLLALPAFYPLRQDVIEKNASWFKNTETYISNGPFKISEINNEKLTLQKNSNYFQNSHVKLDKINYVLFGENINNINDFSENNLSFADNLNPSNINIFKLDSKFKETNEISTSFLSFQTKKDPLDNKLVRQALSISINRTYIINETAGTTKTAATAYIALGVKNENNIDNGFRNDGGNYFAKDEKTNIDKAKLLLEQSGHKGGNGIRTLTLIYCNDNDKKTSEYLQSLWFEKLGITVKLVKLDKSLYNDTLIGGDYDIAFNSFLADFNDPVNFLERFNMSSDKNVERYQSESYSNLLSNAKKSENDKDRFYLMHKCENILLDEMPLAPLYYGGHAYLTSESLEGVYVSNLKYYSFNYAYIKNKYSQSSNSEKS